MRAISLHKKDIILNRRKLKLILDTKGVSYIELYEKAVEKFGIDITYKGFMSLLSNRSTWKLLYAYAITEAIFINIGDVFDVVNIDIEKKVKDKKKWKEKYEKD